MNFRMLKKKYRKMYGQNPPKWMKERLIKTMVSPSEYRAITAIGIKVNELRVDAGATRENAGKYFMRAIFTVVDELRKEMRQYERNTTNLVNTTRTLSERENCRNENQITEESADRYGWKSNYYSPYANRFLSNIGAHQR